MHAVIIILQTLVVIALLVGVYGVLFLLSYLGTQLEAIVSLSTASSIDYLQRMSATNAAIEQIAPHVVGIRATLESVVRLEPREKPSTIEPQLQGLTDSIIVLRAAIETMHADPQDISAQVNGIAESVDLLRSTVQARPVAEPPRMTALDAPQVPTPYGAPKTLLLMNADRSIAHRVTYHRDVPATYAYAGRVFQLHGSNEDGAWEFLPC